MATMDGGESSRRGEESCLFALIVSRRIEGEEGEQNKQVAVRFRAHFCLLRPARRVSSWLLSRFCSGFWHAFTCV
jgi:hypothetical protein